MGRKAKLQKFSEIKEMPNVLEFPKYVKGKWKADVFQNQQPVVLELACGKGEYTLSLAEMFPDKNFVGVDRKGNRIWSGAKKALEQFKNVRFLRVDIENLEEYFLQDEVDEIWITFPDPFLKDRKAKKRLTSPRFLNIYRKILKPGGRVHLKTDSIELFEYSLERLIEEKANVGEAKKDIYKEGDLYPVLNIKTYYEQIHLKEGKSINYLNFSF